MPSSASCSGIDRLQSCAILTKARRPAAPAATASWDASRLRCARLSVVLIALSRLSTYMDLSYQKYINGQHDCTKIRQALPGPGRRAQKTSRCRTNMVQLCSKSAPGWCGAGRDGC